MKNTYSTVEMIFVKTETALVDKDINQDTYTYRQKTLGANNFFSRKGEKRTLEYISILQYKSRDFRRIFIL